MARRPLKHAESVIQGLRAQLQVLEHGVHDFTPTPLQKAEAEALILRGILARRKQTRIPQSRGISTKEQIETLKRRLGELMRGSGTAFHELQKLNEDPTATANLAGAAMADSEDIIDPVARALGENRYENYEPLG